jgi:SAM-dependent methyltransferase
MEGSDVDDQRMSLRRLVQKLVWARRTYGMRGAARVCRQHLGELLSRFTSAGRRALRREIEFDEARGIDTRGIVSLFELAIESPNVRSGLRYQATVPELFHQILAGLPIPLENFVFVDLGSGKGRAVILASEYPFKRVIGVEFSPELHAIARRNVELRDRIRVRCPLTESVCQDVVQFELPEEPLVLYLYNPFLPDIVQRVLERLERSLRERPRPVYVIYVNPVGRELFEASRWLVRKASGKGWSVYAGVVE